VVTFVIITGASIIDRENQSSFMLIVNDTCICDLPLLITISDTGRQEENGNRGYSVGDSHQEKPPFDDGGVYFKNDKGKTNLSR
jgi:hypothetical protein